MEHRCIRRDGSVGHLSVQCLITEIRDGRTVKVFGIIQDITEHKNTEEALLEGEKRFRDLAEMLPEVVFETDREMNLTFANQQAFSVFGYSREEFKQGLNVSQMIAPEDFKRARENIEKRLQGKLSGVKEYRGVKKDGSTFPMLIHAASIMAKGTPVGLRGVIVDITERKKIEEQLLHGQKMKSIGTLAGGIAHDFNNILQPILGYCDFLRSELPADNPQRGYAEGIFKASLRAKELVGQILTFSRQSEQKMIPVQMQQALEETVKLARSTIPSNIDIREDIQIDPIYVMADPTQMHQIVMNLIINAYHAVAQTGGGISIHLAGEQLDTADLKGISLEPGEYAILTVSDTGSGIDPAIMDKIFEPYFTTKSRGENSGLGLAVVYGIVKGHGGDIKVRSEVGTGTTIRIYLPLAGRPSEETPSDVKETYPTGNERILFVDDEEMVTDVGQIMLERLGYRVTTCLGSSAALDAFRKNPDGFDLVITDMTMPEMTGDRLAGELLAIRPGIPVIICTGYSERINYDEAATLGIKELLMKPISISDLSQKVRKALDQ
jgi:PAS domain S-box-containing protein